MFTPIFFPFSVEISYSEIDVSSASVKIKYAVNTYCVKTGEKFAITGPAAANIKKLNDIYRYVIYVKHKDYDKLVGLKDSLEYFIDNLNINDATVQFDFNPMNSY